MDSAISLFGDKNAGGIVLMHSFKDYYYGYESVDGKAFLERSFRDDELKTIGTDIDKIMPPVSRFGGAGRDKRKDALIRRFMAYFEWFRGLV